MLIFFRANPVTVTDSEIPGRHLGCHHHTFLTFLEFSFVFSRGKQRTAWSACSGVKSRWQCPEGDTAPPPTFRHRTLRPRGVNCSRGVPAASWHISGQQPQVLVHVRTRRKRMWRWRPGRWERRRRLSPDTELVWQWTSSETTLSMEISPPTWCGLGGRGSLIPWPVQSPMHY